MATGNFEGLRVLALESRRAVEIAKLIRNYGGEPTVAPALQEVPVESNQEALDFAGRLMQGDFDLVIFFTGVGVRRLTEVASVRYDRDQFREALKRVKVAARGPKPTSALGELGVRVEVNTPEPYTWREMIGALDTVFGPSLRGLRAAVQEYGTTNPEFLAALSQRQVQWTRVPVYHWALPNDLEPLKAAVRSIAGGELDVIVFLTGAQATHLLQVAEGMSMTEALRGGIRNMVVLSIGPSTTELLELHGIHPDFTPSHPKMGLLISEASAWAVKLLAEKRGVAAHANRQPEEPC